jgi:CDP-diacylglycerol--glycerol-3-phosphate 3-phosphatidyltransferase
MNLPNTLTVIRIFLVPLLVVVLLTKFEGRAVAGIHVEFVAAAIFGLASLTDWLDGYLARRRQQITWVGQVLDPIADKLLISATLVSLVQLELAPAWMVAVIIGREIAVTGLRSVALSRGLVVPASPLGKAKMATQVTAVLLLLLGRRLPGREGQTRAQQDRLAGYFCTPTQSPAVRLSRTRSAMTVAVSSPTVSTMACPTGTSGPPDFTSRNTPRRDPAVMPCVPAARLLVVHVACPLALSGCAPQPAIVVRPSRKATVPVGALPATVAVNVTLVPAVDGLSELTRVVVVGAGPLLINCESGVLADGALAASPL